MRVGSSTDSVTPRPPRTGRFRVLAWTFVAIAGLLASLYLGRFFEIQRLKQELATLIHEEQAAFVTQEALRAQLALRDDPETIEKKARELLGLVKPNEEKIIFIKGD